MDYLQNDDHELVFVRDGKRRYRTLNNKEKPPKCRRQLFQESDSSKPEVEVKKPTKKDWITCLKSCLDFDNTTSLNGFQSYFQYMNSYESDVSINDNNNIVQDLDTGKEFLVLNNVPYPNCEDQGVQVQFNHIDQSNHFYTSLNESEYIIGQYFNDVMLSDNTSQISCELMETPSSGIADVEIMGCDIEVDHEEVIQCVSGSFDTLSSCSDDLSGSDEGFPDDFMENMD